MAFRDVWSDADVVLDDGIGQPSSVWTVSAGFRRLIQDMELPRIMLNDLRHAHATHLLEAGVHPKVVSERLGHSSIVVTMDTYSHVISYDGTRRRRRDRAGVRVAVATDWPQLRPPVIRGGRSRC